MSLMKSGQRGHVMPEGERPFSMLLTVCLPKTPSRRQGVASRQLVYLVSDNTPSTSAQHVEGYFLTSLHCIITRKTDRLLSRRMDRCDRMIQNESSDPNGGNVCLSSAVTCTSQWKLRSVHANAGLSGRYVNCTVT